MFRNGLSLHYQEFKTVLLMMDGKDRPKHVEWYSINSKNRASGWFYYRNISRCTVPWKSDLSLCPWCTKVFQGYRSLFLTCFFWVSVNIFFFFLYFEFSATQNWAGTGVIAGRWGEICDWYVKFYMYSVGGVSQLLNSPQTRQFIFFCVPWWLYSMFHIIGHCKQMGLVNFSSPDNPYTTSWPTSYGL